MIKHITLTMNQSPTQGAHQPVIGSPAVQGAKLGVSWSEDNFTPLVSKGKSFDCGAAQQDDSHQRSHIVPGWGMVIERKVGTMRY